MRTRIFLFRYRSVSMLDTAEFGHPQSILISHTFLSLLSSVESSLYTRRRYCEKLNKYDKKYKLIIHSSRPPTLIVYCCSVTALGGSQAQITINGLLFWGRNGCPAVALRTPPRDAAGRETSALV